MFLFTLVLLSSCREEGKYLLGYPGNKRIGFETEIEAYTQCAKGNTHTRLNYDSRCNMLILNTGTSVILKKVILMVILQLRKILK